ncbi:MULTISPECIES: YbjQ family protein [unclassified Adlercreutzia]|uniref:YbjQ family protein n=1 Tax=unclassified Adlercreutzia TaxID=2636013 RepID=UPI0013E9FC7B|nr:MULTISPECIES: YbjQ family protein [unclassified Adlercreutzia]
MIVTTADVLPGQAVQVLGLVRGNIVTSRNVGRDMMAGFKSMVGGEIQTYTDMTNESRQIAEDRMVAAAQTMGANAVVAVRFSSESVAEGTIEMLCYGTAVKFV